MKNLGQLLQEFAKKVGIADDDKNLIGLLSNSELTRINVPAELSTALSEKLISVDDALNNHPTIKARYTALALNPLDTKIEETANLLGLDANEIALLKTETSSYKRLEKLMQHAKDSIEKAKALKPDGKADPKVEEQISSFKKTIDDLNTALKLEKEARVSDKSSFEQKEAQTKIEIQLDKLISKHSTIYDELPQNVKDATIKNLIKEKLTQDDVDFNMDEKGLQLIKKDGSNYYLPDQTLAIPDKYIESILAENKILKTTGPVTPVPNPQSVPGVVTPTQNQALHAAQQKAKAALAEQGIKP